MAAVKCAQPLRAYVVRNLLNLHVPLPSLETCPAPARIPESVNEFSSGFKGGCKSLALPKEKKVQHCLTRARVH